MSFHFLIFCNNCASVIEIKLLVFLKEFESTHTESRNIKNCNSDSSGKNTMCV